MLKRHETIKKRHRSSVQLLVLPHDVVELILERLPVESLLRFKSVSKNWKLTIDCRRFQQGQLIRRRLSRGPDVLCVCLRYNHGDDGLRIVLGSSIAWTVRLPVSRGMICHGSCDGLVCLYSVFFESVSVVVNPATRWHRSFPFSSIQHLLADKYNRREYSYPVPKLGFGKDKFSGTYKPVLLYNSYGLGLDNVTTCEVFDFSTNAWRYVVPASPYQILCHNKPVYLDGSLYWFTKCEETKVLSFDLHTETFQVICKAPFACRLCDHPLQLTMCILDNRLCVSKKNWPTQEIWSLLDSSAGGSKTWKKMCWLDLTKIYPLFGELNSTELLSAIALAPIAILEKNKLLLQGHDHSHTLVIYDLLTKSYDLLFKPTTTLGPVYYFESLFSVLSN